MKPRGWKVQPGFKHNLEPAVFAFDYARRRAKSLGLKWRVRVKVGVCKYPGWWRGHAGGRRGIGQIWIAMNHKLNGPCIHVDRRYSAKNQPGHYLWGIPDTMCYLMAHECGHVIGYGGDKYGEMACNKFGEECVQAWRDRQYQHPTCLI